MSEATVGSVSKERVLVCKTSARFWATHLGPYADKMDKRVDQYATASAGLSVLTALGVWTTLAASTRPLAVIVVSVVAFASALAAKIPGIKGYAQCAKDSRSLSSAYGNVYGDLADAMAALEANDPNAPDRAAAAVAEFEAVREKKEALKPYPAELAKMPRTE